MGIYRDRTYGKFDPAKPLVAARQMTLLGNTVTKGTALNDVEGPEGDPVSLDVKRRLWLTHWAHYEDDYTPTPELMAREGEEAWMTETDGVSVEAGENGWYTIHAAWLPEGEEKVHGAEAAEARAAEIREAGDTKGIVVEATGGGWYTISGPGVPEDEPKVKGQDAANARAAELRAALPPSTPPADDEGAGATGAGSTGTGSEGEPTA